MKESAPTAGKTLSRLVIASRISDLARLQAQTVAQHINQKYPDIKIELHYRESLGDKNQSDPLWQMPERGVFTEDFVEGLVDNSWDIVVHSWKDLPIEERKETEIVGTLVREDLHDLILFNKKLIAEVKKTKVLRVLSSSPRRAYNLTPFLKSHLPFEVDRVEFVSVRGNMPTRISKLFSEKAHALVLAKAAWDRLVLSESDEFAELRKSMFENLSQCKWMIPPLSLNPTAAAQGALAIEVKRGRDELKELLAQINCKTTFEAVKKERQLFKKMGGGCHQKIGLNVLPRPYGELIIQKGMTEAGMTFHDISFKPNRAYSIPSGKPFPLEGEKNNLFERKTLVASQPPKEQGYWVSRVNALPEDWLSEDKIIWCGGDTTWGKLAARGVWVNGCSDSRGEEEPFNISSLVPKDFKWCKLTHSGVEKFTHGSVSHTYELLPQDTAVEFKERTCFYWMSGSTFDEAVRKNPEIIDAEHFCGPGNTYKHLAEVFAGKGLKKMPQICFSLSHWKNILGGQSEIVRSI